MSTTTAFAPRSAAALFAGSGEVRALGRALDWAATPLGAVEHWPQSLRSTVRTLLSSQYPMVLMWGTGCTQIYNDAYARLIGDRHPAGLGHNIRVTLAEAWDVLGPMIERVMASGEANWTAALPLEMHRAGYREEAYFSVSHAPAEDDDGRIVGMLAVCSEVTEQVVGDRRLRLLRDLGVRAGDAVDSAGAAADLAESLAEHPLDIPFALLYLKEGDDLVLSAAHGIAPDDRGAPGRIGTGQWDDLWPMTRVLKGEAVTVGDAGQKISVSGGAYGDPVETVLCLPVMGAQGQSLGAIVAGASPNRALDEAHRAFFTLLAGQISVAVRNAMAREDERRRSDALAALDRAKTTFFSNVSHEFRTPLTLLLGPLDHALADAPDALPRHRDELEMARRNALRLLRLVNTLLDFSRVEEHRLQPRFAPLDLAALVADLASNFRSAVERAGLTLRIDTPALPRPVRADRAMIEKIVLNLLSNAFKFTLEGEIAVRLEDRGGDGVALTVSDSGAGVPPDQLAHIFERFHRVEGQAARSHEGTGIGLALTRDLVELHGGTISVASEGVGRGASFRVALPYGEACGDEATRAEGAGQDGSRAEAFVAEAARWTLPDNPAVAEEQRGPRPRIIIADDNADMRLYIERLLADRYDVIAAADGEAALELARRLSPQLLVSDIMMPGLDGFALLRALRADAATASIPLIFLSARAGEDARVESLAAGADDHIVKPFSAEELRARVDGVIQIAEMRGQAAAREKLLQARTAAAQAQATLAQTEQQVRELADELPVLISHVGRNLRYQFVNRTYEQWFCRPRQQVVGRTVPDILGDAAFAAVRPHIETVLSGKAVTFDQYLPYPDVGHRHVHASYIPHMGPSGAVEGFFALIQDVSGPAKQALLLAESEARIRLVLDAVSDGFYALDADWRVTLFNRAAERHSGQARDAVLGRSLWDIFPHAVGTDYERQLRQAMADRTSVTFEAPSIADPVRFAEFRVAAKADGGLAISFSDVTERKLAERHRELLVDELNHRVKNTLAVVQSMAAQSFRDERVPPEAREAFEGRLMALSHAHSLLTRENWESAPLTRIAEGAVAPFGDGARFRLTGAPIRLNPKAAVSVALALHELCTNAAKYGALSTPSGVVEISWTVPDDSAAPFTLCWREAGGPPVIPPQRRGFGSRLVERGLASELGGRVSLNYPVSGVICEIAAPLAHVEAR